MYTFKAKMHHHFVRSTGGRKMLRREKPDITYETFLNIQHRRNGKPFFPLVWLNKGNYRLLLPQKIKRLLVFDAVPGSLIVTACSNEILTGKEERKLARLARRQTDATLELELDDLGKSSGKCVEDEDWLCELVAPPSGKVGFDGDVAPEPPEISIEPSKNRRNLLEEEAKLEPPEPAEISIEPSKDRGNLFEKSAKLESPELEKLEKEAKLEPPELEKLEKEAKIEPPELETPGPDKLEPPELETPGPEKLESPEPPGPDKLEAKLELPELERLEEPLDLSGPGAVESDDEPFQYPKLCDCRNSLDFTMHRSCWIGLTDASSSRLNVAVESGRLFLADGENCFDEEFVDLNVGDLDDGVLLMHTRNSGPLRPRNFMQSKVGILGFLQGDGRGGFSNPVQVVEI